MIFYFYDEDSATHAWELFCNLKYAAQLTGHADGTWQVSVPGLI